jgi:phosphocarrier protein HPr
MVEQSVTITNKLGLHLRAANELVKTVSKFESDVHILRDDIEVDARSMLGLLGLEAAKGVKITIRADGSDEERVLRAVVGLVEARFNEEE